MAVDERRQDGQRVVRVGLPCSGVEPGGGEREGGKGVYGPDAVVPQSEYLRQFEESLSALVELTRRKNADYAGTGDAFLNFKLCERIGVASVEQGILVRMTDKLQRVANLIKREAQVKDESIADTLDDLAVYSQILKIWLRSRYAK